MTRRRVLAVVAVLSAAAVPVAAAKGPSTALLWQNAAKTATCGEEAHAKNKPATEVLCAATGIPRPKGAGKTGDPFVQIAANGKPQLVLLSQYSWEGHVVATLSKGASWKRLKVTCTVAKKTVKCTNTSAHGFTIGNGKYKSF
jgi:hypothetical protein